MGIGILFLQSITDIDDGHNFIDKIQWAGKDRQLMPGRDCKAIFLCQGFNVPSYRGGYLWQIRILALQHAHEQMTRCGRKGPRFFVLLLLEICLNWKAPEEGFQSRVLFNILQKKLGKRLGGPKRNFLKKHINNTDWGLKA